MVAINKVDLRAANPDRSIAAGVTAELGRRTTVAVMHSFSGRTAMKHAIEIGWRWDGLVLYDPPNVPPPMRRCLRFSKSACQVPMRSTFLVTCLSIGSVMTIYPIPFTRSWLDFLHAQCRPARRCI